MVKNVINEIIIILLLCLAIILVLGVMLYEYVPNNKQIPEEVSYVTPQNVKDELQTVGGVDEDKVILTNEVDQTDLNNYQRINDYKPGKTNPFSTYKQENVENNNSSSGNTGSNNTTSGGQTNSNGSSGNNNQSSSSNSQGSYFQNKGIK